MSSTSITPTGYASLPAPRQLTCAHIPLPVITFDLFISRQTLSRHQWREGDLLLLEAAAVRLGLQVPGLDPWRP
jgi:hypothetical protein